MKKYKLMNPLDYDGKLDVIQIQKKAKVLSQHIGYEKLIITVSLKKFHEKFNSQNTAGNVLLDNSEYLLIHISRDLDYYPESILATLSHEISHKYIHFSQLTLKNQYENEIFTDLTAVFLGYGKLMLNGAVVIKESNHGNTEKTFTQQVGYLNRRQLAFIYLTINFSDGISNSEIYSNLKSKVKEIVKDVENEYEKFYNNVRYYRGLFLRIDKLRYKIAYLEKLVKITQPSNLNEIKTYIKNEFFKLNNLENDLLMVCYDSIFHYNLYI
jgi:hypothetical protein